MKLVSGGALAFALLASATLTGGAHAAADEAVKWKIDAPQGAALRPVTIKTDEGSWIDLDVSPDGASLAFALLGDIYVMPITGGTPTRIAEGMAWEVQPRFSPDGSRIAFTSDRGGGDNIWLMNRDGSDKRQLTREDFRLLNQPSWSPDGRYIAAKKHFTTGRSLGTGEVWLYHVSGGGGVKLVARPDERFQKELGEPIFDAKGSGIYFTRNITRGPNFEYAQDSNSDLFNIEHYDLASGEKTTAVSGLGGSVRPTPSPDGRSIAFVRREATRSKLYIKDLETGRERKIYDDLDQDVQETWAVTGVYPNFDWTPDSRSLIFWAGGKIRRVDTVSGASAVIPFTISDTRQMSDAPHPQIAVAPAQFETRMNRFAAASPDGRQIVFESLGKLYLKPASGGTARRLTRDASDARELFPSWSRDGKNLVFVVWSDTGLGTLRMTSANGDQPRDLTKVAGHYARPRFAPDGSSVVFERQTSGGLTSPVGSDAPGVYRVATSGGEPVLIARDASRPQFASDASRVFMVERDGGKGQLVSKDLNGEAKRVHASGDLINDFQVSPRGDFVAFRENYEVFVAPLMPGGQNVSLAPKADALPVVRMSKGGADWIGWSGDHDLHWSVGANFFSVDAAARFAANPPGEGEKRAAFVPPASGVSLARTIAHSRPSGRVALVGARIISMAGWHSGKHDGGVIADGVVLIDGDRISAVGARGSVTIPADARQINLNGKTIMPGLVDAHAHGQQGEDELVPQQNWSLIQNLALGTTTLHDPSSSASEIFAAAEMQRAGQLLAPRIFSTGEIIYGAKAADVYADIQSYDDALAHVRRLKAQGANSVKNYNQPRREQRQMVVAAARAENMQVVAEGGSLYGMDMTIVGDGNSTLEHNVPLNRFYDDVVQYFAQGSTAYTPTLVVSYGGLAGDPYWRQATDIFAHPLLRAHTPPALLGAEGRRRTKAPESEFVDDDNAREAHKLAKRGVLVSIGAHGQQAGIGPHWELWSFVRGGMSPIEALAAGTIVPARSLGMVADIGSIEPGKLADLVVLDADPSVDIANSDKISRVMLGGRMYDALTMHEVETGSAKRAAYWWE